MSKIDPDLLLLVRQWFQKAREDLWMAEKAAPFPDAPTDLIAFHAQQAAEKCLKGLLTFYQIEFPKIHDLGSLIRLLEPAWEKFPASLAKADRLSAFAVLTRYPHEAESLTPAQAQEALVLAQRIWSDGQRHLKKKGVRIE